tara:strand:+ start:785 stop:1000 length:216 start_codon:yes stop_codon:yes gene_type:complete
MRRPTVTVTVELLPIWPGNMPEEDRTEERYLEIMRKRCDPLPLTLSVNGIYWDSTMKAEFPDGWNENPQDM